jgi:hypothetical protein
VSFLGGVIQDQSATAAHAVILLAVSSTDTTCTACGSVQSAAFDRAYLALVQSLALLEVVSLLESTTILSDSLHAASVSATIAINYTDTAANELVPCFPL